MKRKIFYYGLVGLYLVFIIIFIISFFIIDINKYVKTIYSIFTIILIIALTIYILLIYFKNKIKRKKIKENFFDSPIFDLKSKYIRLHRIFLISSYIVFTFFILASLGINFFETGSPREINGLYYLISHGDIIKEISYQEYKKISLIINQGYNSIAILVVETALVATKKERLNEI